MKLNEALNLENKLLCEMSHAKYTENLRRDMNYSILNNKIIKSEVRPIDGKIPCGLYEINVYTKENLNKFCNDVKALANKNDTDEVYLFQKATEDFVDKIKNISNKDLYLKKENQKTVQNDFHTDRTLRNKTISNKITKEFNQTKGLYGN